jgi:hypothetical protein
LATAELGLEAESRAELESLATGDFSVLPFDEEWIASMAFLAETVRALDEPRHAATLYERLLPYADHVAVGTPELAMGSVERYLGLLAATMSRPREATAHFERALEVNERMGARPWLELTRRDLAELRRPAAR